jgi:PPK2 family polyphosphate:nucleotide phosphotransferase
LFVAPDSGFLVPFDGSFRIAGADSSPPEHKKSHARKRLQTAVRQLVELQRLLFANDAYAMLLVFQGMDASGKDSTIRAVMSGISPVACRAFSFKRPTRSELGRDFLWRTSRSLPRRGRISIFNRSQYEEVLVVRVHPEILENQRLPYASESSTFWSERLESIRDQEKHLARNGVIILKFWLNVSLDEQKKRFLSRLDEPEKNWKFNPDDIVERKYWDRYMHAYEEALNATSRPWAPWYAIPADRKPYMRASVAEIIVAALSGLGMHWPEPNAADQHRFDAARRLLEED